LDFSVSLAAQNDMYNTSDVNNGNNNITACVGYNDNQNQVSVSYIPLSKVLDTVQLAAFTNPSPNPGDPVFIQIRTIPDTTTNGSKSYSTSFLSSIQSAINVIQQNKIAVNVTGNTLLSDIMGQIVIIMDPSISSNIKIPISLPIGQVTILGSSNPTTNYISIPSGLILDKDTKITSPTSSQHTIPLPTNITITNTIGNYVAPSAFPATSLICINPLVTNGGSQFVTPSDNPNYPSLITNLPVNFTPMMVWMSTYLTQKVPILNNTLTNLGSYEELFSSSKSAFIKKSYVQSNALSNVVNNGVVGPS